MRVFSRADADGRRQMAEEAVFLHAEKNIS